VFTLLFGAGFCLPATAEEEHHNMKHLIIDHAVEREIETEMVTYLGVAVRGIDPVLIDHLDLDEGIGLVIETVKDGSPAAKAGLKENDIMVRMEDQLLINPGQLTVLIRREDDGAKVSFEILRKGKRSKLQVILEKREIPVRKIFQWIGGGMMPHGVIPVPRADSRHIEAIIRSEIQAGTDPFLPGGNVKFVHIDPHRNLMLHDDAGSVEMIIDGESKLVVMKDDEGNVIFDGALPGEGDLPDEVKERLDKLNVRLEGDLSDLLMPPEIEIRHLQGEPTI